MKHLFTTISLVVLVIHLYGQQLYKKFGVNNEDSELPRGLNIGEKAPYFSLSSEQGKQISLEDQLINGPVVVIFYRGKWCGVCNKYLSSIQDSLYLIEASGATLLAITPESAENATETREKTAAEYPLLIDADESVMIKYDVLFEVTSMYANKIKAGKFTSIASNNNQDEANLPVPATYIIDRRGNIVYKQFDYDYKVRASVKDMLQILTAL